jgi:hypothetical protein
MGHQLNTIGHLERSAEDHVLRRAIAARVDRALQQAGTSSAKAAKWLSVTQEEVDFWRRGIPSRPCTLSRESPQRSKSTSIGFARARPNGQSRALHLLECIRKLPLSSNVGYVRAVRH